MFTCDFIYTKISTEQTHFQSFNKLEENTHFLHKQAIIQSLQLVQKNIQVHFTFSTCTHVFTKSWKLYNPKEHQNFNYYKALLKQHNRLKILVK